MSMNIGGLIVQMNADSKALARGMQQGLSVVESTVREMKKLGREVAQVGFGITAFFGGMVKAAAGVDVGVKRQLDALKESFLTLAVQISHMIMPAIRQLSGLLRELAGWFAGLPPSTKATISDFALLAIKVGALALVLSKVASVAQALIAVFSGVAGVVAAIGAGPLLLLIAGLVGVLAVIAVLHKAWRTNWNGIRDATKSVLETISAWWSKFAAFLGGIWSDIVDDMANKVRVIVALVLKVMTLTGKMDERSAGIVGKAIGAGIGAAADMAKSPMAIKTLALEGAKAVKDGALDLAKELKLAGKEIRDALGLNSKPGATGGTGAHGYSQEGIDRIEKDLKRGTRISQTSTANTGSAGRAMNYDEVQAKYKEDLITAWDNADWGGMFETVGAMIFESLTSLEQIGGALKVAGNSLVSHLGALGEVINAGIQGFQSGGVWGAIIAVILEIISRFKRWQEILDIGNGQLEIAISEMKEGLGSLIDGFKTIMGGIGMIAHVIHQVLNPILVFIGKLFEQLGGVLAFVGVLLEPVGQLFQMIGPLLSLLLWTMKPVFELIGLIMRGIGILILGIMLGIAKFWNAILGTINKILADLGANDAALEVSKAYMDDQGIENQLNDLIKGNMVDMANKSADAAGNIGKMSDAAADATENLLNVPSGYKITQAIFDAMSGTSTSTGGGSTQSGNSSYDAFQRQTEYQNYRNTGNPTANPNRAKPGKDS